MPDEPREFRVPLHPADVDLEPYRSRDENVLLVEVHGSSGTKPNEGVVSITLSPDAMLALGSSLIRAALLSPKQDCWELFPAKRDLAVEVLGVYLHPSSSRLVVNMTRDLGPLERLLEREATDLG